MKFKFVNKKVHCGSFKSSIDSGCLKYLIKNSFICDKSKMNKTNWDSFVGNINGIIKSEIILHDMKNFSC